MRPKTLKKSPATKKKKSLKAKAFNWAHANDAWAFFVVLGKAVVVTTRQRDMIAGESKSASSEKTLLNFLWKGVFCCDFSDIFSEISAIVAPPSAK